jgi:hypothetical protein
MNIFYQFFKVGGDIITFALPTNYWYQKKTHN